MEVIQKIIASSGLCSRRAAEELIREGRVKINDKVAKLGNRAEAGDKITVDNRLVKAVDNLIYLAVNKPRGYVCTNRKFKDEKNIFDLVEFSDKLSVVGRLDKPSRGLVILTNDGDLVNKLTHPSFVVLKKYRVKLISNPAPEKIKTVLKKLKEGVDIGEDDGLAWANQAKFVDGCFELDLAQGRKRQIRRMFEKLDYSVVDLQRVAIGPVELGNLVQGKWRELSEAEVDSLKVL